MSSDDSINNPDVTRIKPTKPVGEEEGAQAGPSTQNAPGGFSLGGKAGSSTGLETAPSPIELSSQASAARGAGPLEATSIPQLQTQAQDISTRIANLHNVLSTYHNQYPNQTFNPLSSNLIDKHTDRTTNALNFLAEKLRVQQFQPEKKLPETSNVVHFLNYLTGGQDQLKGLQNALAHAPSGSITPAALMTLQLKMNTVQQQIEFFTVIIGKGADDIKNVMNIQS